MAIQQSTKLCECGCGQFVPFAKRTKSSIGHVKGQPCRFAKNHNSNRSLTFHQRFWLAVAKSDTCWIWMAALNKYGYGNIKSGDGKFVGRIAFHGIYIMEIFLQD